MYQAAHQFIDLLSNGNICSFQTFEDKKTGKRGLNHILQGSLDKHLAKLSELNKRGAGIFVMVNQGNGLGRTKADVTSIRAVFLDLDGSPLQPVLDDPLKPQIILETSPGKYHAYWLVEDFDLEFFPPIQKLIAQRFNGDPSINDLSRVMRVPDFYHQKGEPFKVRIHEINDIPRYKKEDIYETFNFNPSLLDWHTDKIPKGQRNEKLFLMGLQLAKQGLHIDSIVSRLSKINETKCTPPLEQYEVKQIAANTIKYGQDGAMYFTYRLFDSPEFANLSHHAKSLYLAIRRIVDTVFDREISIRIEDFCHMGFKNRGTLRKYRDELIEAGFLLCTRKPVYMSKGDKKICGLFKLLKY